MIQNLQEVTDNITIQDQINILSDALRGIKLRAADILGVSTGVGQLGMWHIQVTGETLLRLHLPVARFEVVRCEQSSTYLRLACMLGSEVQVFALVDLEDSYTTKLCENRAKDM